MQLRQAKQEGGVHKEVEELDFSFGGMNDAISPVDQKGKGEGKGSPAGGQDDALQPAEVEMKLDRVFDEIPPNSKERTQFEELFLDDMARALGIPRHLLQVLTNYPMLLSLDMMRDATFFDNTIQHDAR